MIPRCADHFTARLMTCPLPGVRFSPCQLKPSNSALRPLRTASMSAGSEWCTKYGNGAISPYSSPMNSNGTWEERSTHAAASLSFSSETIVLSRSPAARLPTWSWFCAQTTKRQGGRSAAGAP